MKTLTMPVFRRPHYMEQALESIKKCHPRGYRMYIGVEPGCVETLKLARGVDFAECVVVENKSILGVGMNVKSLLDRAFSDGSTFNVHTEEDVVLSPDALDLADWYESIDDEYACLGLVNYFSDPRRPLDVLETHYFTPIGWCVKKKQWDTVISVDWLHDHRGFDFSVADNISKIKSLTLHPALARSNHIGKYGGVHCSVEYHTMRFENLKISEGGHGTGFRIVR